MRIFKSKVERWVYAAIPVDIFCCMIGPIITGSGYWLGALFAVPFCVFFFSVIFLTKYAVRGNEFGVKSFFSWQWFPIDKVESITSASSAISRHQIAIKFSDHEIMNSDAPLEISPKDGERFIEELRKINPDIKLNLSR